MSFQTPIPVMRFRDRSQAVFDLCQSELKLGFFESVVVANRVVEPSLSALNNILDPVIDGSRFSMLKDVDKAADRIIAAKLGNERIGLVTDFDVDGITSAVVMYRALTEVMGFPEEDVDPYINNRMLFGYGFNEVALENLFKRSGDLTPTLLITADQGSNDTQRIATYKSVMAQRGLSHADVIVTDHHDIEDGNRCEDAVAFINPQRNDCEFGDATICGCVVALCVMRVARDRMIQMGLLPETAPRLNHLMTYAGLATVADCVSLQSPWNRRIIQRCTQDMNDPNSIPAWQVLRERQKYQKTIDTSTLGFLLGPLINADSRTGGDGMDAFNFLLAKSKSEAELYYSRLEAKNSSRKEINAVMLEQAMALASVQFYEQGRRALVIHLPDGSHGIHGIVASRVKDQFNCPTIIFSPNDVKDAREPQQLLSGSGRSPEGVHLIRLVRAVCEQMPGMSDPRLKRGGHAKAMGMKLFLSQLDDFALRLDAAVKAIPGLNFYPEVLVDHVLQGDTLRMVNNPTRQSVDQVLGQLDRLEPYGQRFERPVFAINGKLTEVRAIGTDHLRVSFRDTDGVVHQAVLWNKSSHMSWVNEFEVGGNYTFAVALKLDTYNGAYRIGYELKLALDGMNAIQRAKK